MSIANIKFKSKEEFINFVKNAAQRKQEYLEARKNGATTAELNARGFQTLTFA